LGALNLEKSRIGKSEINIKAEINIILDQCILTAKKKRFIKGKTIQKNISKLNSFGRET